MSNTTLTVIAGQDEKVIATPAGSNLLDVLSDAGIVITAPCGHQGTCGKCRVRVSPSLLEPTPADLSLLSADDLEDGIRLACQTPIQSDTHVEIPATSRVPEMRVLVGGVARETPFDPPVLKKSVQWTEQDLNQAVPVFDHLCRLLDLRADIKADLPVLLTLPEILVDAHGKSVTAVTCNERLIITEKGDTSQSCYGIACDIGTTTVVATLVNLATGSETASASAINSQSRLGHDVISRINYCIEHTEGLNILRTEIVETINGIVEQLIQKAEIERERIYEITVVGNATMTHLLMGIHPRALGFLPFVPVTNMAVDVAADTMDLAVNPAANVHVLPGIAGYLGADTVAALLTAKMDGPGEGVTVLADVGTNCEIVLKYEGRLIACSTPAGPAFEGARIRHGMYAGPGAIEAVRLGDTGTCECKVIGGGEPRGICGSGLVDIGAELLRMGLMDETGRLEADGTEDSESMSPFRDRLVEVDGETEFQLTQDETGEAIVLTQRDVRELQLAKAAIRSGIDALLNSAGLTSSDVSQLFLAGGFGSYLNSESAVRLGMIPDMPTERIRFIGNAASVGAKLALISTDMRRRADRLARSTEHLQIAETADFQMRFAEAMLFGEQPAGEMTP